MLSGDNGLLTKTTDAKERTGIAEVVENAKLDILAQIAENKGETISKDQLRTILDKYFENISSLDLPEDLSDTTEKLTAKAEYGGYQNIELANIYNGSLKMSDSSQIRIFIYDTKLSFTNVYERSEENQLINQLILKTEGYFVDNYEGETPTIEECRAHIQSEADSFGISFEENLNDYLFRYDIISATISITVNGETTIYNANTLNGYVPCIGDEGDEYDYTINITTDNEKSGQESFRIVTPKTEIIDPGLNPGITIPGGDPTF